MRGGAPPGSVAGQAQLELVAMLPAVVVGAVLALQLLSVGYAQSLADGAAEAAAVALANGKVADVAARSALPGWAQQRIDTEVDGGEVTVSLRPPGLVPGMARHLEVASSAWVRPEGAAR